MIFDSFVVKSKYNKFLLQIIITIVITLALLFSYTTYLQYSEKEIYYRNYLTKKCKYLTPKLYNLYLFRSKQFNVDLKLALAVVYVESFGYIATSDKNENGTKDYGRFQVNSIHNLDNPKALLKDRLNSYYGFYYLSKCIKKSKGDYSEAVRMYNQGIHGVREKYRNWNYVNRVLNYYVSL